ncbi:flagellar hook protein FlgE [Methylobacterium longum]|uniref:Flagellar hook protein FlgE n=1 Tax=Methylobacterium longum TaxID=767694 RepID=A0ABT8AP74_9HYPH|nr:flagellar hook protein FlgE [Methylobacterium longum]MDN3571652.1 flagellar hook protein FlgE [Methylobacterium longum]GJE11684.1 Flagellar hook protein FlgE [Methylobacterium longum]
MGLYGVLNAGVSGMNAQSNRLSVVADNIQNQNTTGYKRGSAQFSSMLIDSSAGSYNAGSVNTVTRYQVGGPNNQGTLAATTSSTDLAVSGEGFFLVTDRGGTPHLTRAGNFVPDGQTGNLVNAAGMTLMGYSLANGDPKVSLNSYDGLVPVNMASLNMKATPSRTGTLQGNLPSEVPVVAGAPSPTNFSKASSVTIYDNLGRPVKIDLYFAKNATGTWQAAAYDPSTAPPTQLSATTLSFDSFGKETGTPKLTFTVPNGQPFALDLTPLSQVAGDFTVENKGIDGNKPSAVTDTEIAADGTVYAHYDDGSRFAAYRIPLATVASPNNLTPRAGNVYDISAASGSVKTGFPTLGGRGTIKQGQLEQSNVDLGNELADMIASQTGYGANSKVFQTGTEMLETLVNLKR